MKVAPWFLIAFAPWVAAFEARDVRGLDVQVGTIPAPVTVEGVAMHIRVASGRDVPALASRIEQRWRQEGSAPRPMQAGGWQLLGRWEQGRNEVIQWRGTGAAAQLILSLLDTLQQPSPPGANPLPLPPGCTWVRVIEDDEHSQHSANCRLPSGSLRQAMRMLLGSQGWVIRHDAGSSFEASRGTFSGSVFVTSALQPGHSALVWVALRARPGVDPR